MNKKLIYVLTVLGAFAFALPDQIRLEAADNAQQIVEEAQKRIITVVRAMEERGDIKVIRGGGGSGEVMV